MRFIPAFAELDRNGHGDRANRFFDDSARKRWVQHQRAAVAVSGDLRHGTAHVEVDTQQLFA